MRVPVNITDGYTPSHDDGATGTSYLINWRTDATGANVPRPPLVARSITGMNASTTVIGLYVFHGDLIIVGSDRYIYRILAGAPTVAAPLSTSTVTTQLDGTAAPVFAEDATSLFIAGGGVLQKVEALTSARLGNTPGGPSVSTHIAWLGQRLVANNRMTPLEKSYYYWSAAGDGADASWPAANYAAAEARPDEVVAIYENAQQLWIWGTSSLQTYGIGSDATNPYDAISTVNVGLGAIYSPTRVDGTFVFIDETGRVVRSDGHSQSPKDIGADVVTEIRSMSTYADAWGWRARQGRYDTMGLHFPTAGRTFELDLSTGKWCEQAYYDSAQRLIARMPISAYAYWNGTHVFGRSDTNDIATVSDATGLELSGPLLCQRTISNVTHGTPGHKRSAGLRVSMRRGTTEDAIPGMVEVRVRNDKKAWSGWKPISVGRTNDAKPYRDLFFGGVFVQRDYDVRYAGSNSTSIVSITDDIVAVGS